MGDGGSDVGLSDGLWVGVGAGGEVVPPDGDGVGALGLDEPVGAVVPTTPFGAGVVVAVAGAAAVIASSGATIARIRASNRLRRARIWVRVSPRR